jgi:hypothetical protein
MEQIVHMEINKFLLDGSVEPLTMGIHLGCFGVGMIVHQMESFQFFCKMFFEFRSVVRQHKGKGVWENHATIVKEFLGG